MHSWLLFQETVLEMSRAEKVDVWHLQKCLILLTLGSVSLTAAIRDFEDINYTDINYTIETFFLCGAVLIETKKERTGQADR